MTTKAFHATNKVARSAARAAAIRQQIAQVDAMPTRNWRQRANKARVLRGLRSAEARSRGCAAPLDWDDESLPF